MKVERAYGVDSSGLSNDDGALIGAVGAGPGAEAAFQP